ncbi:MAG TPA: NAD-dependent 4,6-dehydratase LegB [Bacillota bacterium]|nr:NAD-dependent 4,6-dehydratase LegB [Bacillota bacterium]
MKLKGQRVLVTGAAGFIGSHLAEELVKEGCEVRAFVRYNSKNDWGWLETSELKKEMEIVAGDIRDYDSVAKAVRGCGAVMHLAALIGIPYSYESPLAYIRTNIEGTYNVLQASLANEVNRVVVTSTSETYGTAQIVPIREDHPLVGQSPYSATKIGADQLSISYYRSFDLPVAIIRPFNTYGPRQSARAIIPTVITQILSGYPQIRLGNLSPTRDFNYVLDTVNGFLKVAESDAALGQVINIGSGVETGLRDVIETIAAIIGTGVEIVQEQQRMRPDKSEVERLWCDNSRAFELTGWKPRYTLKEGLQETIEWFRQNLGRYKAGVYNL